MVFFCPIPGFFSEMRERFILDFLLTIMFKFREGQIHALTPKLALNFNWFETTKKIVLYVHIEQRKQTFVIFILLKICYIINSTYFFSFPCLIFSFYFKCFVSPGSSDSLTVFLLLERQKQHSFPILSM